MPDPFALPQLSTDLFLTDGGIETTLIHDEGIPLPDFACFPLVERADGRAALERYYRSYLAVAAHCGLGVVLESPTWRASADWMARQGLDLADLDRVNRLAVELLQDLRRQERGSVPEVVVSGCIGPRGDGYQADVVLSPEEARRYHGLQIRALAEAGADQVTALSMTHVGEAVGVAEAARRAGLPAVLSFTVEVDGTIPTGEPLGRAVEAVDRVTDGYPAYYMVNCAHPSHVEPGLEPGTAWVERLRGLRANASARSHAELDEADVLDRGDVADLARRYQELRTAFPQLTVLGGCCGTTAAHVAAIADACRPIVI